MKDELKQLPYGFRPSDLEPIDMEGVIDLEKERREVAEFEASDTEGFISTEDLLILARTGIEICSGVCMSREYSGEKCKCIRERFHTEAIYELYKQSREFFLTNLSIAMMGALSESDTKE